MDESDEDQFALENESMDEVHDVDADVVDSEDSGASPTHLHGPINGRRPRHRSDSSDGEESDLSEDFHGSSRSSSSSEDESEYRRSTTRANARRIPSPDDSRSREQRGIPASDEASDSDDDEPPEIPGSPLRTLDTGGGGRMNRLSDLDISNCGQGSRHGERQDIKAPSADILTISHKSDGSHAEENDDYETKESEAPRTMEFHSSSSSSDSEHDLGGFCDDDDADELENNQQEKPFQGHLYASSQHQRQDRPKTAAKDLEPYRELVPKAYYEQLVNNTPATTARTTKPAQAQLSKSALNPRPDASEPVATTFKVRVPREIEELFQHVHAFQPDILDIRVRFQPFIPEYVPAIGVPFDGIQIPRPDGKRDPSGVAFVRESCAQSNTAELELLLSTAAKKKQRKQHNINVVRVHSIEDAAHRPREIDKWITSVAKIQATKPLPQVIYSKPMPSLASLMELWPEDFESFLASQLPIPVSRLDVSLSELIQIVCSVLDIPVYEGLHVQSLHVLFSLYQQVSMYEKEMRRNTR